jgi:predicted phosphodiesterase
MLIAIYSDVHSNLEALNAVLHSFQVHKPDRILFLGDAVGYGPDPNECVEKIFEVSDKVVAGNHDHGAVGLTDIEHFNPFARKAILWNRSILTRENQEKIHSMPFIEKEGNLFLVHASPDRPEKWTYIFSSQDASRQFSSFEGPAAFIGHTHRPGVYSSQGNKMRELQESILTLQKGFRYIVNIGSVGQPRDGNPEAGYVLYDTEAKKLSFIRVQYNFRITQEKMRAGKLPDFLIERLENGT